MPIELENKNQGNNRTAKNWRSKKRRKKEKNKRIADEFYKNFYDLKDILTKLKQPFACFIDFVDSVTRVMLIMPQELQIKEIGKEITSVIKHNGKSHHAFDNPSRAVKEPEKKFSTEHGQKQEQQIANIVGKNAILLNFTN